MTTAAELAAFGRRLLLGDGLRPDPARGIQALEHATALGDAESARLLSVCLAFGVGRARDFGAALDWLARAATLGSDPARAELRALARAAAADDDWAALRRAIHPDALMRAAPGRRVAVRPVVVTVDGFLTPSECDVLIERGASGLERAQVYRGSALPQVAESRTNSECACTLLHASVVLAFARERIAATLGAPVVHFEVAKLLHYSPGEQFAVHGDFLEPTTPEVVRELELRGQRTATCLVYLNDDYAGGETEFPRLQLRHRGRRGDALLFANVDASGAPDRDTVHAGLPTTRGEKWLLSQWVRARPVEG